MTRIVIVEDNPWIRESVDEILTAGGFAIAASFDLVQPAVAAVGAGLACDAALVDLNLPDGSGVDVIRALRQHQPTVPVVAFTVVDEARTILEALRAGARGYLLKSTPPDRLVPLLHEALAGGAPMSAPVARLVVEALLGADALALPTPVAPPPPAAPSPAPDATLAAEVESAARLTPREKDVLVLLAKGLSYPEVARVLGVGLGTVQGYVKAVYGKLEVSSKAEAAIIASRLGLV